MTTRPTATLAAYACLFAVALLTLYPLSWLVARAFADASWNPSLANFREVLGEPRLLSGMLNTVVLSTLSCAFALPIGAVFAYAARIRRTGRSAIPIFMSLPLLLPPAVFGVAWSMLADSPNAPLGPAAVFLFRADDGIHSFAGLIFATTLLMIPTACWVLYGAWNAIDDRLFAQAQVCGATPLQYGHRILLPLLAPGFAAAGLLCLLQGAMQFGLQVFLAIPADVPTMATLIYTTSQFGPEDLGVASFFAMTLSVGGLVLLALQRTLVGDRNTAFIGGGYEPPRPQRLSPWVRAIDAATIAFFVIAALVPFGGLLERSLHLGNAWSLAHYAALAQDSANLRALGNSFLLACAASAGILTLGTAAAWIVYRSSFRWARWIEAFSLSARATTGVSVGLAMIFGFGGAPFYLYGTLAILWIAYLARELALPLKMLEAPLRQIHTDLEEAAYVCGATHWMTLRRIFLPLLRPGIAAVAALTFLMAFREVGASTMLFGHRTEVAGTQLLAHWNDGEYGMLSAFAIVLCAVSLFGAASLYLIISGRRSRVLG